MNKIIFLFLTILPLYVESKYKCAEELQSDICYLEGKEFTGLNIQTVTYVKKCPLGKSCQKEKKSGIGYCLKASILKDIGEKCSLNIECLTGHCENEKCIGKKEGEPCSSNDNCDKPYFCENNTCKALIKEKEACEINADNNTDFSKVASNCEIGTLCGTNGTETLKCIKMYSLDEGTKTYNPYLCKSGIIKNNTCSSLSLIVNSCAVDQKCTYEYQAGENKYKETQNCVSSRSGTLICPLLESDSAKWKEYQALFDEEIKGIKEDSFKDNKLTELNRIHLGKEKLIQAATNYYKHDIIEEGESCINNYFYQLYCNEQIIKLSLMLVSFLFIF